MGNSEQDLRKEVLAVYFCAFLSVSDFFPSLYSASLRGGPGIRGALGLGALRYLSFSSGKSEVLGAKPVLT